MLYFSETETPESPRETEEIGATVWRGLLSVIRSRVTDGAFGAKYPEICEDGTFVCGVDMVMFDDAMRAEIPELAALDSLYSNRSGHSGATLLAANIGFELGAPDILPSTLTILDLIEFCWKNVAKPSVLDHHAFFRHSHLGFDEWSGKGDFRNQVETIFRRNGIAYRLTEEGRIERLVSPVFQSTLVQSKASTGDAELDRLMDTAQRKFLDPHAGTRREALDALWDAWERLKTLDGQGDKKSQAKAMLDKTAGTSSPKFRDALEREARELTSIGNSLRIRHSETSQEILAVDEHVDYLFYRLFSLIHS